MFATVIVLVAFTTFHSKFSKFSTKFVKVEKLCRAGFFCGSNDKTGSKGDLSPAADDFEASIPPVLP